MSQPPQDPQPWQPGQNPPPGYQPPAYPPSAYIPAGTRRSVTTPKISIFDWIMLICTAGMWYPVVWLKKRRHTTVTKYRY